MFNCLPDQQVRLLKRLIPHLLHRSTVSLFRSFTVKLFHRLTGLIVPHLISFNPLNRLPPQPFQYSTVPHFN